jgi:chromosome segregation ATPase
MREEPTMSDDLVKRAKAAMAEHEAYVAEQGGTIASRGLVPELVASIEEADRAIANLQREYDKRGDRIEALEWEREGNLAALELRNAGLIAEHARAETAEAALAAMKAERDDLEATKEILSSHIRYQERIRQEYEARLAKMVKALQLAVVELEEADASNMTIAFLYATLAEIDGGGQ